MVSYRMIAVAGFFASGNALPLNINLGAYSPALVVGDGEISFGGGQDVTSLMNALEGAAVSGATSAAGTGTESAAAVATPDTTIKDETVAAQEAGQDKTVAAPVATTTTTTEDPNLQEQAAQISTLQGMGKEIAPREDSESPVAKRDLEGFDHALTFAEAALTKGPTIQLGTGEGGAGVGIIVDNNGGTVGEGTEAATAAATVKRDDASLPRRRTKVTRMYVKRGIPASVQTSSDFETRTVESLSVVNLPGLPKRDGAEAIDAINLNVAGDEGITMTFLETGDEEDSAQEVAAIEE
ncbi:Uu.00g089900.m01.CDS01 [Anthostomella pinea]|uniref:Uu.00g089900.m01.CDS01 n=1 Tax=Anthostomella pinea TaxID=933095 RepID=A0AAI8VMT7_9PEZI|nr:Uu.00g089900.m01.CDS01 [Anthostomella pinea]